MDINEQPPTTTEATPDIDWHAAAFELQADLSRLLLEIEEYDQLIIRQGALLTGVADALRGLPPKRTAWSHHDLPELAAASVAEVARLTRLVLADGS